MPPRLGDSARVLSRYFKVIFSCIVTLLPLGVNVNSTLNGEGVPLTLRDKLALAAERAVLSGLAAGTTNLLPAFLAETTTVAGKPCFFKRAFSPEAPSNLTVTMAVSDPLFCFQTKLLAMALKGVVMACVPFASDGSY